MFDYHYQFRRNASNRNVRQVFSEILLNGPLPRNSIAARIGITEASVSRITRHLLDIGLIEETGRYPDRIRPGRRRVALRVSADGCYVAGIAINAFQQDVVVANFRNEVVAEKRLEFSSLDSAEEVLTTAAHELNEIIDESNINRKRLVGCGVAITGAIDPEINKLRHAPALGWTDVAVADLIEGILGVPIFMENIPNAKSLAVRYFGPARKFEDIVLFNCSLAIGVSLTVNGELLKGAKSNVGLIDSLLIPDESTRELLPFDVMAGGVGVLGEPLRMSEIPAGDLAARLTEMIENEHNFPTGGGRSLEQAGRALGYAVMMANALLHPQSVLISGPMIGSSRYRNAATERVSELVGTDFAENKLMFLPLSSREAAQSLAIHHCLADGGFLHQSAQASIVKAA